MRAPARLADRSRSRSTSSSRRCSRARCERPWPPRSHAGRRRPAARSRVCLPRRLVLLRRGRHGVAALRACRSDAARRVPASRCSGRPARASRRCCSCCAACSRPTPAACCSTAWRAGEAGYEARSGASASSSRCPRCSSSRRPAATTWPSGRASSAGPTATSTRPCERALAAVGLPADRFGARHPYSLSGGEQRRLALAGVLAMRPGAAAARRAVREPRPGVAPRSRSDPARPAAPAAWGCVLATHDVDRAYALCDERVVLDEGVVVDGGPVAVRRRRRGRARSRTGSSCRSWSSCGGASAGQRPRRRARSPRRRRRCARMRMAIAQYYPRPSLDPPARPALQGRRRDGARRRPVPARVVCRAGRLRPPPRAGLLLSRVPLGWIARGLRPVLWLLVLTFVVQLLFAPGPAFVLARPAAPVAARARGRRLPQPATGGAGRRQPAAHADDGAIALTDALAWLGRPLRRLRVPTEELALMVTIALRFIPTLLQEVDTIMKAQRARGASFTPRRAPAARARARAGAGAAVHPELPARRRARPRHGGALLPAGGAAHAAAPAARARARDAVAARAGRGDRRARGAGLRWPGARLVAARARLRRHAVRRLGPAARPAHGRGRARGGAGDGAARARAAARGRTHRRRRARARAGRVVRHGGATASKPRRLRLALNALLPAEIVGAGGGAGGGRLRRPRRRRPHLPLSPVAAGHPARVRASLRLGRARRRRPGAAARGARRCSWGAATSPRSRRRRASTAPASARSGRRLAARGATAARRVFEITADSFLHNMVRVAVGTMVDVAQGRMTVAALAAGLAGGQRRDLGRTAPARGLALVRVDY